jgi:hypothetical protein
MTVGMPRRDSGSVHGHGISGMHFPQLTSADGDGGQRVGSSAALRAGRVRDRISSLASWGGHRVDGAGSWVGWGSGRGGVVVHWGTGGRDHRVGGGADDGAVGWAVGDRGRAGGDGELLGGVDGVLSGGHGQKGSGDDGETHLG